MNKLESHKPGNPQGKAGNGKKDFTSDLPLVDLQEAINFVSTVHDKALETAPMKKVAEGMGYAAPSSTPFYRRMTSARLFGLLSTSGAELSVRARDYLRPDRDQARESTLKAAILGIPLYSEELQRHLGKKINIHFVANSFSKSLNLTDACAQACAKVFESSLRFASFLSLDGVVQESLALENSAQERQQIPTGVTMAPNIEQNLVGVANENYQSHTLFLDGSQKRKFTFAAPLVISGTELERIKKWLEVTLIVENAQQLELPNQ